MPPPTWLVDSNSADAVPRSRSAASPTHSRVSATYTGPEQTPHSTSQGSRAASPPVLRAAIIASAEEHRMRVAVTTVREGYRRSRDADSVELAIPPSRTGE